MFRPTADCILNSFRNSGKRHLILTGGRGSGKTSLLREICAAALPGITTFAQPGQAVYLTENLTGSRACIGVYDETHPGPENRMRLCRDGFETLGVEAIQRCIDDPGKWASIDEIGYLECGCETYRNAILRLMDKKRVVAIVRKQDLPFLDEICGRNDAFCVDMDAPYGNTGCVIMASGMGKRFGGNKLMADFGGQPMIMRTIRATEGIFARRVVVTRHEDVADICKEAGVEVVLHDLPHRSDTVRLGLEALGMVKGCMFCPGDQPLLKQETVAALALAGVNDGNAIWRAAFGDEQGSPVLFPPWAYEALLNLPEGKGGGYVIRQYPEKVRMIQVMDAGEIMDADTNEDLNALLMRRMKAAGVRKIQMEKIPFG